MPTTVLFDMGGVLLHLKWDRLCASLAKRSTRDSDVVRTETANGPIVSASMRGELSPFEFYEAFSSKLGLDTTYDELIGIWNCLLEPNEAIDPLIAELRKEGYYLALASNTDRIHFAKAMDCVETVSLFELYFLSCEMGLLKPDPNFFTAMLEDLGVPPEDCVFIDDTQPNVEAAKKLGITALHFRGEDTLRQELRMVL